mgnify:CR=1 FL=1
MTPPLGATCSHTANGCSPTADGIDGRSPTAQYSQGDHRLSRVAGLAPAERRLAYALMPRRGGLSLASPKFLPVLAHDLLMISWEEARRTLRTPTRHHLVLWGCMLPLASLARRPCIDERSRRHVAVRAVSPRSATVFTPLHVDIYLRASSHPVVRGRAARDSRLSRLDSRPNEQKRCAESFTQHVLLILYMRLHVSKERGRIKL